MSRSRRHLARAGTAALLAVTALGAAACSGGGSGERRSAGVGPARLVAKMCATAPPPARQPAGETGHRAPVGWRIPARPDIEGFANRTSVVPGDAVTLYVSTGAAWFVVRAYRVGAVCRQVWASRWVEGHLQPPAVVGPAATGTVHAPWRPSLTIATRGWPSGDYLLVLETPDGRAGYVPLAMRTRSAAGRVVLVNAVTTWQAYNLWGCCDLYEGGDGAFSTRSRAVSFDRPYLSEAGAGQFIRDELAVVALAERQGLPLDYVTDVDLQQDPHLLDGARAVVTMGHDEYWSPDMRAALTRARDAGTNIAFFGANGMYRRIRFAGTPLGPDRLEINYKVASQDPMYGVDNSAVTSDWPSGPDPQPESELLGDQYACNLGLRANVSGVIAAPSSWVFAGLPVRAGETLPGLIGPETDAVQPGYPTPRPIEVLLHSPAACPSGGPLYADASYYVAPSGAGVFDAGSIAWACAVGGTCGSPLSGVTVRVVRAVTANILNGFAAGPAGPQHPAVDNLAEVGIVPGLH